MHEVQKPGVLGKLFGYLYMGAIVFGIPVLIYTCVVDQTEVRDAGNAYLQALRDNRLDDAYSMIAKERKTQVPRDAFPKSMHTPDLKRSVDQLWNNSSTTSAGMGCLTGGVQVDGGPKSLRLYMWLEADRWTVHTVAYDHWELRGGPWLCD